MNTPEGSHQSKIVELLQDPNFYSPPVDSVSLRETHISVVFLTGDVVYKIKKPVDMDFLDFSTLEKRRHFCYREVELNRRLTRDVYLDVVPITFQQDHYDLDGSGRPVEYAVKMRQLPHSATMVKLLRKGELGRKHINLLAQVLSRFFEHAKTGGQIDSCGSLATIRKNCEENFMQLKEFAGEVISLKGLLFVRSTTRSFLNRRKMLFKRRIDNGKIRECHGDLRAGHIYFTDDEIQIIDCIEFNERFRYNDVACDLAFLAMDLDFEGFSTESQDLLKYYVGASGDADVYILMNFYKSYRALVRVKVNCLRLRQGHLAEARRSELLEETQRYMELACQYVEQFARPTVWVVCGMSATGKSTIAKAVAKKLGVRMLSSDLIRKELLPDRPPRYRPAFQEGIYSKEATSITYGKLLHLAQEEIDRQNSVILDATFGRKHHRRKMLRLADELDANIVFIECTCSDAVIKHRLRSRDTRPSISDARLEHFENLKANYESLDDIPQSIHITVDTQKPPEDNIRQILSQEDLPTAG